MAVVIYGIKACDTMKKARAWLEAAGVDARFHDYKTQGLSPAVLDGWIGQLGWEVLLNRSGTTFRKLADADREGLTAERAKALMLAQPSMIKRPVLDIDGMLVVGFKPEVYAAAFSKSVLS